MVLTTVKPRQGTEWTGEAELGRSRMKPGCSTSMKMKGVQQRFIAKYYYLYIHNNYKNKLTTATHHILYRLSSGTQYFIQFIVQQNLMQTMKIFYSFLGYNEAQFLWLPPHNGHPYHPPAGGKIDSHHLKCFVFHKIGSVGRQHSNDY